MKGTVEDSAGRTWKWVSQGKDCYALELVRGDARNSKGIYQGSFYADMPVTLSDGTESTKEVKVKGLIIDGAPLVRWRGMRYYPDSLTVHEDGRVISGSCPEWECY